MTYTNNWPHEELVGNHPTSANLLWSMISIVLLIAGVGALVWYKAFRERSEDPPVPAEKDPLRAIALTPSTFNAPEVVPLALIGFEAWETYKMSRGAAWMHTYRWPVRFFLGVAFWNMVGAGVFGFLIF